MFSRDRLPRWLGGRGNTDQQARPVSPAERGGDMERLAERWLGAQGLTLVARNVRCRHGEIDLVMRDAATLVFVEVRYRQNARFGGAVASVDRPKQARLAAAAAWYLQRHPTPLPCRFDVLAIASGGASIDWIRHAFTLR
jgi:putative endonuclease